MTIATAALITAVAGTALTAYGQYQAGQAEEKAAKYNAAITERNAVVEENQARTRLRKLLASQRALYAKAGIDITQGSPLLVLAETAAEGEKEALNIRYGAQESAAAQRVEGKQAARAGTIAAGSTLLTGFGQTAGNYFYKKKS